MNENWRRPFFTVAIGQAVSLIGSSAVQFALIWWLAIMTDSPLIMSMAGLVAFMPQFLLGPFAGVFIDRLKKHTVVISADLFIGIMSGIFALYYMYGEPKYWIVFVILGLRGVGGVFHTPAIQALIPRMVPAEELMKANGWNQFMQAGAFMLGPVLGGIMYGALSMPVILFTDLLGALVASAAVWAVKIEEDIGSAMIREPFFKEFKDGLRVFMGDDVLRHILVATFISMIFFMPLSSLYPLITSSYFELGSVYGSIVKLAYAVGMMLISLFMGGFGRRRNKIKLSYIGITMLGATSTLCGVLPPAPKLYFWIFALICMIMGASSNFYSIPLISYMQENIKQEVMGRAFSLWGTLMSLAMPVGLLISGPMSEKFGVTRWFFMAGVVIMMVSIVSYAIVRSKLHD